MRTKLDVGTHRTFAQLSFWRTSIDAILIVGGVGDCWEANVGAGLRRIPKELVLPSWACTELSIKSKEQLDRSSGRAHEGHRQPAEED